MHCITIKATTLWLNIDNVAVITYKNDASVYQCAVFIDFPAVLTTGFHDGFSTRRCLRFRVCLCSGISPLYIKSALFGKWVLLFHFLERQFYHE